MLSAIRPLRCARILTLLRFARLVCSMFVYAPFLGARFLMLAVAAYLRLRNFDAGLCVDNLVNLVYFSLYARVLLETLLLDSMYWRRFLGER